jgi:hypothetical protein
MRLSKANAAGTAGVGRLAPILCLLAILVQVLALPLHERQLASLNASSSSRSPASTLPLGGHDDSTCVLHAGAAAARAAAPAERVAVPLPPAPVLEPARAAVTLGTGALLALARGARAPPLS